MKKHKREIITIAFLIVAMMIATACNKPKTVEEYIAQDKEMSETINKFGESSGMTVEIKGNDIIYTYDLSTMAGYNEEDVKNEAVIDNLTKSIESFSSTFSSVCTSVEEATKLDGVHVIVNYTYGDETLLSRTFDGNGVVISASSGESVD